MNSKSWDEIADKIRAFEFAETFDMIVAIANGGIIPAALINQRLLVRIELLKLSFRNAEQKPIYESPRLMEELHFDIAGKTILLVEDRVKTGATLQYAVKLLAGATVVKTFAVNGKADYSLFDETCFKFPWVL
jgi:hypoxanthine phosphoribosyltransferase